MTTSDVCLCGHARRHHSKPKRKGGEWGKCWAQPWWHPDSPLYRKNDCEFFEADERYVVMRRGERGRFAVVKP